MQRMRSVEGGAVVENNNIPQADIACRGDEPPEGDIINATRVSVVPFPGDHQSNPNAVPPQAHRPGIMSAGTKWSVPKSSSAES